MIGGGAGGGGCLHPFRVRSRLATKPRAEARGFVPSPGRGGSGERRSLPAAVGDDGEVVGFGGLAGGGGAHTLAGLLGGALDGLVEGTFADEFDDFGDGEVVDEAVAGDEDGVAPGEGDDGAHFDAHFGGADVVEDDVSVLVVHGFVVIEDAGLHGEADGGMGDGEELDPAALSDDEDDGIADMVGTHGVSGDFEGGDGGAGTGGDLLDAIAGIFDAGEDAGSEGKIAFCGGEEAFLDGFDGEAGGCFTEASPAHAVGDGEDLGVVAEGMDGGGVLVGGFLVGGAGGEDDGLASREEMPDDGVHVAFAIDGRGDLEFRHAEEGLLGGDALGAPGAEGPEGADDAGLAGGAAILAALDGPLLAGQAVAPGTVFHEGHQVAAGAVAVVAGGGVAFVGKLAGGGDFESGAVAPGAELPVEFHAALAAGTAGGEAGGIAVFFAFRAAPGAVAHGLGDGALALRAAEAGF